MLLQCSSGHSYCSCPTRSTRLVTVSTLLSLAVFFYSSGYSQYCLVNRSSHLSIRLPTRSTCLPTHSTHSSIMALFMIEAERKLSILKTFIRSLRRHLNLLPTTYVMCPGGSPMFAYFPKFTLTTKALVQKLVSEFIY